MLDYLIVLTSILALFLVPFYVLYQRKEQLKKERQRAVDKMSDPDEHSSAKCREKRYQNKLKWGSTADRIYKEVLNALNQGYTLKQISVWLATQYPDGDFFNTPGWNEWGKGFCVRFMTGRLLPSDYDDTAPAMCSVLKDRDLISSMQLSDVHPTYSVETEEEEEGHDCTTEALEQLERELAEPSQEVKV